MIMVMQSTFQAQQKRVLHDCAANAEVIKERGRARKQTKKPRGVHVGLDVSYRAECPV